jgi:putative FmdB family regulatory protein
MPIYEYQCLQCGARTELLQRLDGPPLASCPQCGGEVKKLISSPAFQFKGSGWYKTDYASKKGGAEAKSEGGGEGGKSEGAEKAEKTEKADKPKEAAAAGAKGVGSESS